MIKSLHI